ILRKKQYRLSDDERESVSIAKHMIIGKIFNSEQLLKRTVRDHALRVDVDRINRVINKLRESRLGAIECNDLEETRRIDGNATSTYYSAFSECILHQSSIFLFRGRTR